uniref:Putative phosphatidylinositol-glycan biosynthesis class X protein n=1 Tax=Davidia involucrata TaxID=16924 RepID=A0A5B7BE30_DAVIN
MEIQHFQVHIYLIVGIQVIFLAGIGSCMLTVSHSCEVGRCNSDFDENHSSIRSLPCFEKYITESYFGKHDSLVDLDFQDFIAHELPLGSCELLQEKLNIVPKVSVLHRYLIGEGSHRRLSSSIRFNTQPGSISELPVHFCEAIIIERLPSGIFADPFELQHLLQRGVFRDAAVFGDTNLELPSVASNRSVVEIHMDVGPNVLSRHENGLEINIELPLHARYPPVEEHGFSRIEFGTPDLFIRCSIEGKSHNQSCLFMSNNDSAGSKNGAVVWKVPCGIKEHAGAVFVVTYLSAVVSALLIVLTSIYYSEIQTSAKI